MKFDLTLHSFTKGRRAAGAFLLCAGLLGTGLLTGCSQSDSAAANADDHDHDHETTDPTMVMVSQQVRDNLGITFARVEKRNIGSYIYLPGRFEPRPDAVREYHTPLAGRVNLLVRQYEKVTTGTPLYTLDSSEWRRMQQDFANAQAEVLATSATLMSAQVASAGNAAAVQALNARLKAADDHIASVEASVASAQTRLEKAQKLQSLVGGRLSDVNEARAQLNSVRSELTQAREDRAELEQQRIQLSTENQGAFGTTTTLLASTLARRAEYEAARARRDLLLQSLHALGADASDVAGTCPEWDHSCKDQAFVTVYAAAEGLVNTVSVSSGAYIDASAPVLSTVNPVAMRFRAVALQSDLDKLQPSMKGKVLKPAGNQIEKQEGALTVLAHVGLEADPDDRTLDVVADLDTTATWARAGVSTNLELLVAENEKPELSIPAGCVVQDGIDKVIFVRDRKEPDKVRRKKADLGLSDGHYITLHSGVRAGDEVVLDGVYELKLATAMDAGGPKGHQHADGTFHVGEH